MAAHPEVDTADELESMEFLVPGRDQLNNLKRGERVSASVRKQGRDYVLDDLRPIGTKPILKMTSSQ
jgi:hypothetical protein